ncbi:P-loop NTPase [Candidatus Woesearchaeota archaeon]|jgi:septum site-determining protein MinD|nr:P-loop NTPase [Candidatus Woesearchaeota archaeon]MBT5397365.1 P-loop NTPase [Candidatus Woesearchaeota archaeon]MBT6367790.1 P-loop NTPase [Candidatus Woesearchaeota archaeon]MBT7762765.1 P-loop NTPase [Candidatus Woesearchaeota archaeon]
MTKFIAVVSGKGGVGKTTSVLNIAHAIVQKGKKVIVVDANLATPNISIQLGLIDPQGTLNKFLRKEKGLKDITYLHESGISIIPASPSYSEFQKTNSQNLHEIFDHLDEGADFVLIDSPSGLGYDINQILKHSDESVIVTNPNLSSVMDALKTVQAARANNNTVVGVILNMTHRGKHELSPEEVKNILHYPILANVRRDRKVHKSVYRHAPLHYLYPRSHSAKQFRNVAEYLCLDKPVE